MDALPRVLLYQDMTMMDRWTTPATSWSLLVHRVSPTLGHEKEMKRSRKNPANNDRLSVDMTIESTEAVSGARPSDGRFFKEGDNMIGTGKLVVSRPTPDVNCLGLIARARACWHSALVRDVDGHVCNDFAGSARRGDLWAAK